MTCEQAYQTIGNDLAAFPCGRQWDEVLGTYVILKGMVSCRWSLSHSGKEDKKWIFHAGEDELSKAALDAVRFLRDHFLATTGDRIWGLTFTLYPDGKFKIEYDYNKPEGYEETDETITLDEAMKGLPKKIDGVGLD